MRDDLGSIREVSPGVFDVQVSAGRDANTGKRVRPSRRIRGTIREAKMLRARMLLEVGNPEAAAASMSLKAYFEDVYLPSLDVREMTLTGYKQKLSSQLAPLHHVPLDSLTPYQVQRVADDWRRSKLDPQTALHAFRLLRAGMRRAVKWRLIPVDPTAAVDPPKVKEKRLTLPDAETANKILDAFSGHPIEPIVVVILGAGLRRSEAAGLTWADVDLKAGTVTVERGLHQKGKKVWVEPPKTERSKRTVTLPAWAVDALRPHRRFGALVQQDGKPMPPETIAALYKSHMVEKKLPWVQLRQLRHTSATLTLAQGVDVVVVSRRLGHSTVMTTDAMYLRPDRSADVDAAQKLDGFRKR